MYKSKHCLFGDSNFNNFVYKISREKEYEVNFKIEPYSSQLTITCTEEEWKELLSESHRREIEYLQQEILKLMKDYSKSYTYYKYLLNNNLDKEEKID